jgi:D-aminopeptidase
MPSSPRARDLGLLFDGEPGPFNAITDVDGVHVGMMTIIEDTPRPGRTKLVRTGVTAILPHAEAANPMPVWAGVHRFNGNGEMTGTHWIADGGYFTGPVIITNTHAVGMAHHAATGWMIDRYAGYFNGSDHVWAMPVVAETYDGVLNDINARPVTEAHVRDALDRARGGPVPEGNVGGGTGMICYQFKGGTGTASRRITVGGQTYTVACLVQANHGLREWLTIQGVPVGRHLPLPDASPEGRETGSIIGIIATDLPLAPHQLQRVARRGALGIARGGTIGGNGSGDLFLAFSTANQMPMHNHAPPSFGFTMLNDNVLDAGFAAAVQCVEEAVVNSMIAARDMGGTPWDGGVVPAIDHAALQAVLSRYGEPRSPTQV